MSVDSTNEIVWVPHEKAGFALARLMTKNNDGSFEVELLETNERHRFSRDDCCKANPKMYDKCEDMTSMPCLNEPAILHNLSERFYAGLIYTYSGLFCVVINPYRQLLIYSDAIAEGFRAKRRKDVPPHIFAVTDEAYRNMLQDREDQSILCTGESGAGKTENTKKVVQYLAHVTASRKSGRQDLDTSLNRLTSHLEDQLLQTNPILEAFGNSKTVKNDNSSRFGKFIRIHFDATGCICGANIEFYLLEKSRVLRQAQQERAFHAFYQLLKVEDEKKRKALLLEDGPDAYRFLSNGDIRISNVDDRKEFSETMKAMDILGFSDAEIHGIWKVISAILLFGNLDFGQENRSSDQAVVLNDIVAQKIGTILGLNSADLVKSFLKPKIKVQRDHVHRSQNEEQAKFAVEAIAKACYERLFRWLVQRLNKSLDRTRQNAVNFVGILDIAGFEIFEMNSFEQLCINYTNEKLQQFFNNTMFIREQQEYMEEGLDWKMIDFGLDLQPTIELIEKPMGVLSTLDDMCLFPQGSDASLVERLINKHRHNPKFVAPELRSKSDFSVIHYAGRVDYSASGWRVKNMDPLNDNVVELLRYSKDSLVSEIWKDVSDVCTMSASEGDSAFGSRVKRGMFRTVSQLHKDHLTKLMMTLSNTNPHFVRCIVPNHEKRANLINGNLVLEQLRCNGVLEGIRICRQGYPNRLPFLEFRQRYERLLTPSVVSDGFVDGKEAVKNMMNILAINPQSFRIGRSKIFFRTEVLAELEMRRDERLSVMVNAFQAYARGYIARNNFRKYREQVAAIRLLQRNGLAWMKLREWQWWKLFSKVKPLVEVTNKDEIIEEKEAQLKYAQDRLRTSESLIQDLYQRLDETNELRSSLQQKLDIESFERSAADDARIQIVSRLNEVEDTLANLQQQIISETALRVNAENDRKRIQESMQFLEDRLSEEEQKNQILVMEKNSIEQTLRQQEADRALSGENHLRTVKDKHSSDLRCKELADKLIDEEEKVRSLTKQKTKLDEDLLELQQECNRQRSLYGGSETRKQGLESELSELRERSATLSSINEELSRKLSLKEQDILALEVRNDTENAAKLQLERNLRDLHIELDEVKEDLEQQKSTRLREEKNRRDLSIELETYKQELEESQDKSALNQEMRAKREEDLRSLQRQLEEVNKEWNDRLENVRQKHQKQMDEMGNDLELCRKQKSVAEKGRQQLESDLEILKDELSGSLSAKSDGDRKRKQLETQLLDSSSRNGDLKQRCEELEQRLSKISADYDSTNRAREMDSVTSANLIKKIAHLDSENEELTKALEDSKKSYLDATATARKYVDELNRAEELSEQQEHERSKAQREITSLTAQLSEAKRRLEEEAGDLAEELKIKMSRDLQEASTQIDDLKAQLERAERSKKKALQETDDAVLALEEANSILKEAEKRQRRHEQTLAEEKANAAKLKQSTELSEQQTRDAQTKILKLEQVLDELRSVIEALEKDKKALRLEVDDLASNKDEAGKSVFELKKSLRRAEEELAEKIDQLIEIEDAYQLVEEERDRFEIKFNTARQEWERTSQIKEQEDEDKRRSLLKQVRDLEEELHNERRLKSQLTLNKNKAESENQLLQSDRDSIRRELDEANRQLSRMTQLARETENEGEQARVSMNDAITAQRELQKSLRFSESEISRLSSDISVLQLHRKKWEEEREDMLQEITALQTGSFNAEHKKRLECTIEALKDDLDAEQSSNEIVSEKWKQTQIQVDRLTAELLEERTIREKLEVEHRTRERNLRDIASKVESAEALSTKTKGQLATAEALNRQLQLQISDLESQKNGFTRQQRRHERTIGDLETARDSLTQSAAKSEEDAVALKIELRSVKHKNSDLEEELRHEKSSSQRKEEETRHQIAELERRIDQLTREVQMNQSRVASERRSIVGLSLRDSSRRYGSSTNSLRVDDVRENQRSTSRLTSLSDNYPNEEDSGSNQT